MMGESKRGRAVFAIFALTVAVSLAPPGASASCCINTSGNCDNSSMTGCAASGGMFFPDPAECANNVCVLGPTDTPTQTPTDTPTQTPTASTSATPSSTPTQTPTATPTQTSTRTFTVSGGVPGGGASVTGPVATKWGLFALFVALGSWGALRLRRAR